MPFMKVSGLKKALTQAAADGRVDTNEVDRLMLKLRDSGGLSTRERKALLKAADGFDDAAKQRVLSHVSAMGQKNAWVNVDGMGTVANVEGRYATVALGVKGLSAKVGLFDNCISMKGTAAADGRVSMQVEGRAISIDVKKGDTAAQVLKKLQQKLPASVAGVNLSGDVQPWEPGQFTGARAQSKETAAHLMLFKPQALGLQPGETPMRVVVTGYGAFMGITDNPSATMAQKLTELGLKGAIVEYRRLDVTTDAVDAFMAEMKKSPPDVVLSMGVSPDQAQVEERPENFLAANRDGNDKMMKERTILPGQPNELSTDLPVMTIDGALQSYGNQRAVFTSKSDPNYSVDRSAYLCNYLGFNLAAAFGQSEATTGGFMHINATTPVDQMHSVLEAVAARQADIRRTATGRPQS